MINLGFSRYMSGILVSDEAIHVIQDRHFLVEIRSQQSLRNNAAIGILRQHSTKVIVHGICNVSPLLHKGRMGKHRIRPVTGNEIDKIGHVVPVEEFDDGCLVFHFDYLDLRNGAIASSLELRYLLDVEPKMGLRTVRLADDSVAFVFDEMLYKRAVTVLFYKHVEV